jgi:hypothetical protein
MAEAAQRYEQEQSRLRDHHGDEEDLHIEAPKAPEINPEIIKDVEPLLFRGFLHVPAEINGVMFVFKSLNQHEFELLNLTVDSNDHRGVRRYYNQFMAYGVLMIDGVNILPERDQWVPEIAKTFGELDESARRKLIRYMSEVNRRASRATILAEVYCMEGQSRLRWSQYQKMDLTSPAVTGFAGTQNLGLNWAQLTWRAVNYYEDTRETTEREWENAKFIAGAFAGAKGLSSVNSQDKQRREKDSNDRVARRDKILRAIVLGESYDGDGEAKKGAPVKVARTVEELADQLEKDLRGEQDWHDKVVEEHERRSREEYDGRQRQLVEFREAHIEKYGDKAVVGGVDVLEGLTREEVQERITKRQADTARRLASQRAFPEAHDPKLDQFRQKWASAERPPLARPKRGS